jgi:tetratricopeptide (TPR) repeat protein
MERNSPGLPGGPSKAELLRERVESAADERSKLAALLSLARHYVDVGDGVRGYATALQARTMALRLRDFAAASSAMNSISVSQYNRSEYVSAINTALDAWDYARRAADVLEFDDSCYSIGLSLFGLGVFDVAEDIVKKGLATAPKSDGGLEIRIRLTRLRGIIASANGDMEAAERDFDEAISLAEKSTPTQREASHALWAIAWLRQMDEQYAGRPIIPEKLQAAREHLEKALAIAEEEGDAFLVTDRTAILGIVASLQRDWDRAEQLLGHAMDSARSLDYVRASVISTVYLARLYLDRGDAARASTIVRHAIDQALRGAADDVIVYAREIRARALEKQGHAKEADRERRLAEQFLEERQQARKRSAAEAVRLVAPVVGDAPKA